ncbi:MFS transporter [Actinomadura rupiterrae]|uniref:MFS transporter n=1 Tax=Actinomadura rupiterrae TaxID=559627 RepID=UPI0020A5F670|nr:MFS transporter [Actinomadura rupiterrae]MCP2342413.1 EmrB/QacA subfamily drug resistance transporter [Actinomadura rupiterrae]
MLPEQASDHATEREDEARGRLALGVLAGCQLALVVDASIVNIALPSVQRGLGFSGTGLSWVVNAYTLAFGGLLLLGGRAGDLLGHRRTFMAGVAVFTLASLAGGLATTPGELLAARAAQGAGAAFAGPGSLALIATTFPDGTRRSRALAVFAIAASAGMVAGLMLGGLLTAWTSWRAVMFVNVPVGAVIVLLAPRALRESPRRQGRFDLAGALTCTLGSAVLVYGLIRAAGHGWSDGTTVGALCAAAVLLGLFPVIEARARQPIMPLGLWGDRERVGAFAMRLLLTAAMSGMMFFLTLFVQGVLRYGPLATGFGFLPTTVALVAVSRAVPRLLPRYGPRPLMAAGSVLCVAGMVWLAQVSADGSYLTLILGPVLLFGAGSGMVSVAATFVAMASVPSGEAGAASAVLQSMQQIGGSLGVAALVTVDGATRGASPVDGMRGAFTAGAVLTVAMVATALFGFRRSSGDQGRSGSQI